MRDVVAGSIEQKCPLAVMMSVHGCEWMDKPTPLVKGDIPFKSGESTTIKSVITDREKS